MKINVYSKRQTFVKYFSMRSSELKTLFFSMLGFEVVALVALFFGGDNWNAMTHSIVLKIGLCDLAGVIPMIALSIALNTKSAVNHCASLPIMPREKFIAEIAILLIFALCCTLVSIFGTIVFQLAIYASYEIALPLISLSDAMINFCYVSMLLIGVGGCTYAFMQTLKCKSVFSWLVGAILIAAFVALIYLISYFTDCDERNIETLSMPVRSAIFYGVPLAVASILNVGMYFIAQKGERLR